MIKQMVLLIVIEEHITYSVPVLIIESSFTLTYEMRKPRHREGKSHPSLNG